MEDGPVGGELVPEPGAARRIGDLKPIPGQVRPECRALAESLRELFGAVGVSLRVFAVRLHYDAGTVSRYLNGTVVPPAEFVDQLLTHAAKATGRPSSTEVMAHVHTLQRRALQATNKVGWELQRLRDQLADADRQRQQAEVRAEALSEALLVRKQRIAEMEVERRRIAVAAADRGARGAELDRLRQEREDLTAERDRLREEVARLQDALAQARRQALDAERRCEALEHQLQTEEEAAGAKAAAEDPVAHRLRLAEEQANAAQERARRLEGELAALRGGDADPGGRTPMDDGQVPDVWGGVPRRNPRFTGRDALLTEVYDRLDAAPADTAVVALVGPPGIGKSQLAAEYAHRFAARYDVVWWSTVDGRPPLEARLAALAPVLVRALGEVGVRPDAKDADLARAALEALRRGDPYRRWLIVLDDADDPEAIAGLLPAGGGHVLITSRNRAWADHYAELLEIPPLNRTESVALVRRRAPRIGPEDADRLAAAVEDLPLALDQTAGWLDGASTPVAEYVRMVSDGEPNPVRPAADYPMPYHAAFKDLITRLRETTKAAAELLRVCALFGPGPVPLALLRAIPAGQVSPAVAALLENPSQLQLAIGKLAQWSVMRWSALEDEAVWMSRFVRDAVRRRTPEDKREKDARVVRGALVAADPRRPDDPAAWPRYARLVPYLEQSGALESPDAASRRLVVGFLTYLALSGDYGTGRHLAERAAGDYPELAARRAALLRETGDYAAAEALDRSVLKGLGGSDAPGRLVAMARLGADLRGLARYDEAYELARRQRDLCAVTCPQDGAEARNAQRSLSRSLRMLGSYAEATELSGHALDSARAELGPTALVTLACETEHAYDLRLSGRHRDASELQAPSVDRHCAVLGTGHPLTLSALYHLWRCDWEGDLDIHALWERAKRLLGEDAPLTLMIGTGVARVLRHEGDPERAGSVAEETATRYRAALGDRHPYTIGALANHALTLPAGFALGVLDSSLRHMKAAVGERHPWTLGIALNTAARFHTMGREEDAWAMSRETARRAAEALGERHPLALVARLAFAADLEEIKGGRDEARTIKQAAIGALEAQLGPQHPQVLTARQHTRPGWDFEPLPI
ncbi:FxSxx-COOH system tetratricopeptide repeat protein [Streptomyces sp. PSAA01]|uniref:FxSxx-COOH system tetratricopeptide repeat protein n=1 Tax=Streptomyces sp. PSAA01 TaxID=2912762 RepID=UPI001F491EB3|nr:FxSxx-COOH system tetratricopeptide repeat protein [Streptomyces sp. PSAA01]MCG0284403.1 FxSxx-COOH system tetratricopeptide repeat protein [Streptomyces sp. PSAA01]